MAYSMLCVFHHNKVTAMKRRALCPHTPDGHRAHHCQGNWLGGRVAWLPAPLWVSVPWPHNPCPLLVSRGAAARGPTSPGALGVQGAVCTVPSEASRTELPLTRPACGPAVPPS